MSALTAHITTFNCARTLPSSSHLAASLFSNSSTLPPDLVVLCLQEIAPIGHAFLGGSHLAPYFASFTTIVQNAMSQHFESSAEYIPLLTRNAGLTALMVFARPGLKDIIRWVETAGVGVGMYEMGNKGAVGVRLGLEGDNDETVPVTFVSAHLAPMEDQCQRRNADWKDICEGLVFTRDKTTTTSNGEDAQPLLGESTDDTEHHSGSESTLFSPLSHVFFAGDLNYRTADIAPDPSDHKIWPHPTSDPSHPSYRDLWANDQLNRELRKGNTLHLLDEATVNFPPTYKYSTASRKAAEHGKPLPSGGDEKQNWPWAKHRVPSWCDRILYLSSSKPGVNYYDALPVQPTSDHRPVSLSVSIPLRKPEAPAGKATPFGFRKDWKERRAVARNYEVLVGIASYLALTWEGEAILFGSLVGILGGYVALRAMLGS